MRTGLNKLIIIGNGFDPAHGLKTSYKDFIDWYFVETYKEYCKNRSYSDTLIQLYPTASYYTLQFSESVLKLEEVLSLFLGSYGHAIKYHSQFFDSLVDSFKSKNWVDIEREYFSLLKSISVLLE